MPQSPIRGKRFRQAGRNQKQTNQAMPKGVPSLRARRAVPPEQRTTRISESRGLPKKGLLPRLCAWFPKTNKPNHFEARGSKALPEDQGRPVRQSANYPSRLETKIRAVGF